MRLPDEEEFPVPLELRLAIERGPGVVVLGGGKTKDPGPDEFSVVVLAAMAMG